MSLQLVIWVRFHDGRYHGTGDWPPSPARLFQALVAGCGLSGPLSAEDQDALQWLEKRCPPIIGAPRAHAGQGVTMFVPGNDLDKFGGDPRQAGKVRDLKAVKPRLFDPEVPFFYAWTLQDNDGHVETANRTCALAERLYQLGRGVDFAWAWGELLDPEALDELVLTYPGSVFRPAPAGRGDPIACPDAGSLESLEARYRTQSKRFTIERQGRATKWVFLKPPAPYFKSIPYDSPCERYLYELRQHSSDAKFSPWPQTQASKLVTWLRDAAVDRLLSGLPSRGAEIERVLVGHKPDGTNDGPTSARVRIIPLPSIGHPHADREIRRVLIEVPPDCPLPADDVGWAFSGLDLVERETGELLGVLIRTQEAASEHMLSHYGVGERALFRQWQTVTPAALPSPTGRRPGGSSARAKSGIERRRQMVRVADAVRQAFRHADVRANPTLLGVQREPFEGGGERAEAFAPGTRFGGERLWHVEVTFSEGIPGPLAIGDGRFLGLGIMAPIPASRVDAKAYDHEGKDPAR